MNSRNITASVSKLGFLAAYLAVGYVCYDYAVTTLERRAGLFVWLWPDRLEAAAVAVDTFATVPLAAAVVAGCIISAISLFVIPSNALHSNQP